MSTNIHGENHLKKQKSVGVIEPYGLLGVHKYLSRPFSLKPAEGESKMITILTGTELKQKRGLRKQMFSDRAQQFSEFLGWGVSVSPGGEEQDEYDSLNPVYVIASDVWGRHQGSMRFLPTIGRTMVNEHFSHLNSGLAVCDPKIWEATRFCLSQHASGTTAMALMAAGGNLM